MLVSEGIVRQWVMPFSFGLVGTSFTSLVYKGRSIQTLSHVWQRDLGASLGMLAFKHQSILIAWYVGDGVKLPQIRQECK